MTATTIESLKSRVTSSAVGRSALIYLPVCWLVLQVTDTFVQQLGLPRWVFTGALLLMSVGLVVVMISAVAADRAQRAAEAGDDAPARLRGWTSRRRLVLGGVFVLGAWGLITAGYMGARAAGIGPFGTLVASGAVAEGGEVLIADFANRTKDAELDEAVRQALVIDLGQSRLVKVVDPRLVAAALQRMERDADAPVTPELAREIAQREGYAAVLEGELSALGPATLITARLVAPKTGDPLAVFEERAREPAQLLDAVDRLTGDLRNKIGESLKVLRAEAPLEQVTTASLPALRLFSEAQKAGFIGDRERSVELLQRAVELDPQFAMAWRRLGLELRNIGRDPARSDAAIRTAYANLDRLPERERGLTEGAYWATVGDYPKSRDAYARVLAAYPDDPTALNGQGIAESTLGNLEVAQRLYQRTADQPPPRISAWGNVLIIHLSRGRVEDAAATLARMETLFPDSHRLRQFRIRISEARQDWARSEAELAAMRSTFTSPEARYEADLMEGTLAGRRGDLAAVTAAFERTAAQDAADKLTGTALIALTNRPWMLAHADRRPEARAALVEALRRFPLAPMQPAERPYFELAELWAFLGDAAEARRYLAMAAAEGRRDRYVGYDRSLLTAGSIAMAEGRPAEAVDRFTAATRTGQMGGWPVLYSLGQALEAAGRPEEARAVYRRRVAATAMYQPDLGFALERLVALDAAAGDRAGAADAARRLALVWTASEFRPRVLAAQQRAAAPIQNAGLAAPAPG